MSTTRTALYARVSTSNNGQSPEMQLRELREYCERRGWTAAGDVDTGISGAKDRRPELDRLMADVHKRRFDVVVVWKFARFARSVSHLLRALDTFRVLGIEFVSLSELDITCVRLKPYKLNGQVLMDLQQLIPLPEAEEYETKIRAQQQENRLAETSRHAMLRRFWRQLIERSRPKTALFSNRTGSKDQWIGGYARTQRIQP